jgi:hypothetical protein
VSTATIHGVRFRDVHEPEECRGRHCIIHYPVHTHMDDWPAIFRDDTQVFERIDPLGCGHPDPSQFDYWEETGQGWKAVHSCTMDAWGLMSCDSSPQAQRARKRSPK